jgi:glycine betaine/choline ABC-type transport system substrate-binding protein
VLESACGFRITQCEKQITESGALAITVTNRDATEQKFTVIEDHKQKEQSVKPGATAEFCAQGCMITMPDGEDYEFDGPETVSIEEGLMFLEDDAPASAASGGGAVKGRC